MSGTCPSCRSQAADDLLCERETNDLRADLRGNASVMGVAELVDNLHVAQAKLARIGAQPGSDAQKGDLKHERLALNLGAMDAARHLENILTSWARDLTNDKWRPRGDLRIKRNTLGGPGPFCPACLHESCAARRIFQFTPSRYVSVQAADVLLANLTEIRRHPAVDDLVDELTRAIGAARQSIDRPDQFSRFPVGPCPEDFCSRTVFALCPAEDSERPALMACYLKVDGENRPDLGAGFMHSWTSVQFYRAGARIRAKMEQDAA